MTAFCRNYVYFWLTLYDINQKLEITCLLIDSFLCSGLELHAQHETAFTSELNMLTFVADIVKFSQFIYSFPYFAIHRRLSSFIYFRAPSCPEIPEISQMS